MPDESEKHSHLFLGDSFSTKLKYLRNGGGSVKILPQERHSHGNTLFSDLKLISRDMLSAIQIQQESGIELDFGIRIEFESFEGFENAFEDMTFDNSGIELLCISHSSDKTYASVFVPDGKLDFFEKKIRDYQAFKKDKNDKPIDNHKLIDTIQSIHTATLRKLWTDDLSEYPESSDEQIWWEVWLSNRGGKERAIRGFLQYTKKAEMITSSNHIDFLERTVFVTKATRKQMEDSMMIMNSIAELRRAKETAEFFTSIRPGEQKEWLDDLVKRSRYPDSSIPVPYICVLDTGINNGHPLLEKMVEDKDLFTVDSEWGTADRIGHGTAIAGTALFGDLMPLLISKEPVYISHRLESVKILNKDGGNTGDEHFHASLMKQAVYRSVANNPNRIRLFQLAITANDYRDNGRPSAWSSVVDMMAFNRDFNFESQLFIISAGNIDDSQKWIYYPEINKIEAIHDPGQAWNALTVGAYTDKVEISEPGTEDYIPLAEKGALSPFSCTSYSWDDQWPIKPDIVMEGGNVAKNSFGAVESGSLSLLTTNSSPSEKLFTTINATSAASALASRLAAEVKSIYPEMRAETLRGLIVHSATWTDTMKQTYLGEGPCTTKGPYGEMVRHCGFGVPNLESALWTVKNSLTMIIEDTLQPFGNNSDTHNEMKYYSFPWPKDILLGLGSQEVEMRVTLSYFIEPNPSSRGRSRYTYQSHGLRFDVNQRSEDFEHFKNRVSATDREKGKKYPKDQAADRWCLGKNERHRGSLHSDIWRGPAVDLALSNIVAVYPAIGWWKKNTALKRMDSVARYSLLVSLRAPNVDVDLLTPIKNQIATQAGIAITV